MMDTLLSRGSQQLASQSQVAFAEFQFFKYLANEEVQEGGFDESTVIDPTLLRQHDGKLGYLKSQMEINPTEVNVYALVDEIRERKHIDEIFQ